MKIFEYLATGVPIVASTIGSAGEVLTEKNCFPFDPENYESIAQAMQKALSNKDLAHIRARNGLQLIREKHTWDIRTKEIVVAIEKWFFLASKTT